MKRVLIVDDNESVRDSLEMTMRRQGYEADLASNAKTAMKRVREHGGQYEAVFLDQKLGRDNRAGLALLVEIKAEFPDLPVVLFTGQAENVEAEALNEGAYAYLPKEDYHERELVNLLRTIKLTNELQSKGKQLDSERRGLQQIIDQIGDEITVISPDFKILMVNRVKRGYWGLTHAVISKKLDEIEALEHTGCLTETERLLKRVIKSGNVERGDYSKTDPQGRRRTFNLVVSPIKDENNQIIMFVESARDVTKPRETTGLVQQLQELQGTDVKDERLLEVVADGLVKMGYDRVRLYLREYKDGAWYVVERMSRGMHARFGGIKFEFSLYQEIFGSIEGEQLAKIFRLTDVKDEHRRFIQPIDPAEEWIVCQVIDDGEAFGKIAIDNKVSGEPLTASDTSHLEIISRSLGQALQINHQLADAKQLSEIDEMLTRNIALSGFYRRVLSTLKSRFKPDGITIREIGRWSNKNQEEFTISYAEVYDGSTPSGSLYPDQPVEIGVNGRVRKTGKAQFVVDVQADKDYKAFVGNIKATKNRDWIDRAKRGRSLVSGPLVEGTLIVGALSMEFFQKRELTRREQQFFQAFCKKVSIALTKTQYVAGLEMGAVQNQRLDGLATMSAGLAHQLNTPLQNILTVLALLEIENTQENRDEIAYEVDRITKIIKALRDYAKPAGGHASLVSLERLIGRLIRDYMILSELDRRKITCDIGDFSTIPLSYQSEGQLEVIFDNLISNAIDAMEEEGGVLTIHPQYVASNQQLIVCVSDTGVGIPPQALGRLFAPFYSTKHSQNMGMGLALVKSKVEQLEGKIKVESEVGKGSTFTVTLPWTAGE